MIITQYQVVEKELTDTKNWGIVLALLRISATSGQVPISCYIKWCTLFASSSSYDGNFSLKSYLFLLGRQQSYTQRKKDTERSSIHWYIPQMAWNSQNWASPKPGVSSLFLLSNMGRLCCFSRSLAKSWIKSGEAGIWTSAHVGSWYCRLRLSMQRHCNGTIWCSFWKASCWAHKTYRNTRDY